MGSSLTCDVDREAISEKRSEARESSSENARPMCCCELQQHSKPRKLIGQFCRSVIGCALFRTSLSWASTLHDLDCLLSVLLLGREEIGTRQGMPPFRVRVRGIKGLFV